MLFRSGGNENDFIALAGTIRFFASGLILERLLIIERVEHAISSNSHNDFLDVSGFSAAQLSELFIRKSFYAVLFYVGFLLTDK